MRGFGARIAGERVEPLMQPQGPHGSPHRMRDLRSEFETTNPRGNSATSKLSGVVTIITSGYCGDNLPDVTSDVQQRLICASGASSTGSIGTPRCPSSPVCRRQANSTRVTRPAR